MTAVHVVALMTAKPGSEQQVRDALTMLVREDP